MAPSTTDKASSSTDVAVRSSTDVAQLQNLEDILLGIAEPEEVTDDPAEIQREILMQLLDAKSDEELEADGGATGWRELEGVPVEIHGFRWRPSTIEGAGLPVFFVVQATRLDTGARVVLTTGSASVLAQLTNMAKRGTLVGAIRTYSKATEKPTRGGYWPMILRTPDSVREAATKTAA